MNVNRGNVRYLWIFVGGYLLYLAWQQIDLLRQGGSSSPIVSLVTAPIFAAVGGLVIFREWQAYRYAQAHKDDPETWGDPAEEPELPDSVSSGDEKREDGESFRDDEEAARNADRADEDSSRNGGRE